MNPAALPGTTDRTGLVTLATEHGSVTADVRRRPDGARRRGLDDARPHRREPRRPHERRRRRRSAHGNATRRRPRGRGNRALRRSPRRAARRALVPRSRHERGHVGREARGPPSAGCGQRLGTQRAPHPTCREELVLHLTPDHLVGVAPDQQRSVQQCGRARRRSSYRRSAANISCHTRAGTFRTSLTHHVEYLGCDPARRGVAHEGSCEIGVDRVVETGHGRLDERREPRVPVERGRRRFEHEARDTLRVVDGDPARDEARAGVSGERPPARCEAQSISATTSPAKSSTRYPVAGLSESPCPAGTRRWYGSTAGSGREPTGRTAMSRSVPGAARGPGPNGHLAPRTTAPLRFRGWRSKSPSAWLDRDTRWRRRRRPTGRLDALLLHRLCFAARQ